MQREILEGFTIVPILYYYVQQSNDRPFVPPKRGEADMV